MTEASDLDSEIKAAFETYHSLLLKKHEIEKAAWTAWLDQQRSHRRLIEEIMDDFGERRTAHSKPLFPPPSLRASAEKKHSQGCH